MERQVQPRFVGDKKHKEDSSWKRGDFLLIYLTACARILTATSIMAGLISGRRMRLLRVLQSPLEWPTMVQLKIRRRCMVKCKTATYLDYQP